MNERTHSHSERLPGSGGGALFDEAPDIPATVTVSSGPYHEDLPAGNLSVGEIRGRFGDRFDLDPNSQAVVDGHPVGDDVVVRPGQALMFTRPAGEKGARTACRPVRPRIDSRGKSVRVLIHAHRSHP